MSLGDRPSRINARDYFLDPTILIELENTIGSNCTLEAFCNNDATTTCQVKCHQDSFLDTPVAGHQVWIHPPPELARDAILHYKREKLKDPSRTSALILLPASRE